VHSAPCEAICLGLEIPRLKVVCYAPARALMRLSALPALNQSIWVWL